MNMSMQNTSGRDKAQALVAAYAKHANMDDAVHRTLDENNDRSFGDFGFHYFPEKDVLQARILVVRTHIKDWPEYAEASRKTLAGLNDPTIGGMYDHGGGYFFGDEDKDMCFLAKDYPVATISPITFIVDMDNLRDLSGIWITKWLGIAAEQIHGSKPKPTQKIDRQHDPYPRGY